jgi:hypothetical protein
LRSGSFGLGAFLTMAGRWGAAALRSDPAECCTFLRPGWAGLPGAKASEFRAARRLGITVDLATLLARGGAWLGAESIDGRAVVMFRGGSYALPWLPVGSVELAT